MAEQRGPAGTAEVHSVGYRPLTIWDAAFCWRLAADPEVRALSHDPKPPTLWGHLKWMRRWTLSFSRDAWLIRTGWQSLGLVRAEGLPGGGSVISIAVLREARGRGVGTEALRRLTPRFQRTFNGPVYAVIKAANVRSYDAFMRAGYVIADEKNWQRLTGGAGNLIVLRWGA